MIKNQEVATAVADISIRGYFCDFELAAIMQCRPGRPTDQSRLYGFVSSWTEGPAPAPASRPAPAAVPPPHLFFLLLLVYQVHVGSWTLADTHRGRRGDRSSIAAVPGLLGPLVDLLAPARPAPGRPAPAPRPAPTPAPGPAPVTAPAPATPAPTPAPRPGPGTAAVVVAVVVVVAAVVVVGGGGRVVVVVGVVGLPLVGDRPLSGAGDPPPLAEGGGAVPARDGGGRAGAGAGAAAAGPAAAGAGVAAASAPAPAVGCVTAVGPAIILIKLNSYKHNGVTNLDLDRPLLECLLLLRLLRLFLLPLRLLLPCRELLLLLLPTLGRYLGNFKLTSVLAMS